MLSTGPKGHCHLPVKQGVVQDNGTSLFSPDPVLLGVTSAAGGGGVQLPVGGRGGRGLAQPLGTEPSPTQVPILPSVGPSPGRMEPAANSQGHLTKDISSRAESQHQLLTRPETFTLRLGF